MKKPLRTGYISFLLSLLCVQVLAQTAGQITGEVKDPSGAVISGATVMATSQATGAVWTTVSNQAGVYSFPTLQPGRYDLRVEMAGFRAAVQNNIELQVQQIARLDFSLQVGELAQAVEVSGRDVLLNTEDATVGTVIENKRITELPLNGRNFLQLIALSPNVSANFANQQFAIAGQRREFNYYTLDGVDNTDVNFNTYVVLPSIDALQEFKVQSGVYPAEFGRATGQVNASTKPGTNEYHGTVFEFLRNDVLDAKPYAFTSSPPEKSPFKWNQYGFTLGGPVWIPKVFNGKGRLFFMSNFEGFRERQANTGIFSVPSAAMRNGDFSELLSQGIVINQPFTSTPISGNIIPQSQFDPIGQKLLDFYPAPNVPGAGLFNNYQTGLNFVVDKDQFIQRVDFVENSRSNWFGRYSWGDEQQVEPAIKLNGRKILTNVWQVMISNTRVFSPTQVNEFRFGTNKFFNSTGRELAFQRDVLAELDIPDFPHPSPAAWGIPAVSFNNFDGFGDDTEGPYENRNVTFQWVDNFSWIRGKHSLRLGLEIRRDRFNQTGNQFSRGSFIIDGQATGYDFADYLFGYSSQNEAALSLAVAQFRATSQSYYVDDIWKVRPNLTVNLGFRYEFVPPWTDKGQSQVNAYVPFLDMTPNVPDLSRHPVLVRVGAGDFYEGKVIRFNPAIQMARDGRLGDRLIAADYRNFAPRLGISWSPGSRWTLRTGGGIFYAQDTGNPRFDTERNFGGRRRDNTDASDPLTFSHPFHDTGAGVVVSRPYVLANVYNRRTPYSIQYLLNIQRELDSQTVLEVGYLGSVSHRLERLRAFNEALPGTTGSVASRQPYPEFGRIQEVDGSVNANYNSLGVKLSRRFSRGLTYLVGYTWSKAIDSGSGIRTLGADTLFPQNSYCLSCERSLSIFDVNHRFVTSLLYELPFGKSKTFLNQGGLVNALLGGWQLSSIITIQSGFPLTVQDGNVSLAGGFFDRPDATGISTELARSQRTTDQWFNTAAYVQQADGTFGNVGRNTVIGPGITNWDFSTLKDFHFTEGKYLQFRFEAFNILNHPIWGDPDTYFPDNTFGKIRSTRIDMRQLQFGLKFVF
ncbi:MAG: hypothetical protein DMG06_16990 [Acidobacteria bacterium]|nr:MAG: hypothetical protein DMG06_16990 [Acidobacteriota bacterium]